MSYSTAFSLLLSYHGDSVEDLSKGTWLVMCGFNIDNAHVAASRMPSEPMEHVHAYGQQRLRDYASRIFAQDAIDCPPPAENVAVADLPVPAVAGPVVGIPKRMANLDCRNKLVKRGVKVSYQGFRGIVVRVNRGRCVVGYLDAFDRFTGWTEWVICERLQVVA